MAVAYARPRRTRSRYGDGSLRQVRPGVWRYQLSAGSDPVTGKRRRLGGYESSRDAALALKARIIEELARDETTTAAPRAGTLTLGTWFDRWLADLEGGNSRTQDHRDDWGYYIKTYLGQIKLRELTGADVSRLVNKILGSEPGRSGDVLSATSRHHVWSVLHRALQVAMEDDKVRLERNVASGVKVLGYRYDGYQARILCDAELTRLEEAALEEDVARAVDRRSRGLLTVPAAGPLLVLSETGIRFGELAGLTVRAVDLERGTITIVQQAQRVRGNAPGSPRGRDGSRIEIVRPKSRYGRRTVDITPHLRRALERHLDALRSLHRELGAEWNPRGLLMPTISGLPTQNRAFTDDFRRACTRAGITFSDTDHPDGLRVHDLRHTFACRELRRHGDIYRLQRQLGHSSIKMTERYLQFVSEAEIERARARVRGSE